MARRPVTWILLLAILAGSTWLAWLRPAPPAIRIDRNGEPLPDYYLTHVTLRQFGADGALLRLLEAQRMAYTRDAGTDLTGPTVTIRSADGAPWQVTAERGQMDPAGEWLALPDEVLITRRASLNNRPLALQTRALRYRLAQGYAETDEAVTVASENDRVDAVGMQAWLQEPGRIRFKSQVRGHYEP